MNSSAHFTNFTPQRPNRLLRKMANEKFRKDYKVTSYCIYNVELTFKIFAGYTQVNSFTGVTGVVCFLNDWT